MAGRAFHCSARPGSDRTTEASTTEVRALSTTEDGATAPLQQHGEPLANAVLLFYLATLRKIVARHGRCVVGDLVTVEADQAVATIRLNRPPMNALSAGLQADLAAAAAQVNDDPSIRAVVIYGGEKLFAAGADVREMSERSYVEMIQDIKRLQDALNAMAAIAKPVIAAVTGYALGGGLELALCADFRILGESAQVGQPEILLGLIPGAGGTQRLPRLIGPAKAKDLIFTGRFVRAAEALAIGLADTVVPDDQVHSAAREMAAVYAAGPAIALAAAKNAIDVGLETDLATGLAVERASFAGLFATEDARTGMRSFLENGAGKAAFSGR